MLSHELSRSNLSLQKVIGHASVVSHLQHLNVAMKSYDSPGLEQPTVEAQRPDSDSTYDHQDRPEYATARVEEVFDED